MQKTAQGLLRAPGKSCALLGRAVQSCGGQEGPDEYTSCMVLNSCPFSFHRACAKTCTDRRPFGTVDDTKVALTTDAVIVYTPVTMKPHTEAEVPLFGKEGHRAGVPDLNEDGGTEEGLHDKGFAQEQGNPSERRSRSAFLPIRGQFTRPGKPNSMLSTIPASVMGAQGQARAPFVTAEKDRNGSHAMKYAGDERSASSMGMNTLTEAQTANVTTGQEGAGGHLASNGHGAAMAGASATYRQLVDVTGPAKQVGSSRVHTLQ